MKILRVRKTNLFDVFVGDGWENWTRISKQKSGESKMVAGNLLSAEVKSEIEKFLKDRSQDNE